MAIFLNISILQIRISDIDFQEHWKMYAISFIHRLTSYATLCTQESQNNSKVIISKSKKDIFKKKRTIVEYIPKLSVKNRVRQQG